MMMRTVFSLSLLILPVSMVFAADNVAIKSDADLATLVRTHGFVSPTLVQSADEATVGEAVAAQDVAAQDVAAQPAAEAPVGEAVVESPVPMAENAMPASEGEVVYEAPVRHHHHYSAPQRRSSRGGLFSELIELERRKNAWLKRTFFGR